MPAAPVEWFRLENSPLGLGRCNGPVDALSQRQGVPATGRINGVMVNGVAGNATLDRVAASDLFLGDSAQV